MGNTIYSINKGINRPLEFRGLKAQYIGYFGGGLVVVLMLFSAMYIAGLNPYLVVVIGLSLGCFVFYYVYRLNGKYGQHGLMRKRAQRKIPNLLKSKSRRFLIGK